MRTTIAIVALFATLASPASGQARERHVELAGRSVVVWPAVINSDAPQPLVLFSHGFGGCATQSRFLMEALADHGYWVFAVDHADASCGRPGGVGRPQQPFRDPDKWSDATYRDRAEDLRAVLEALHDDADYAGRIDFSRVALVGHSLGGYTVLGLGGAWPSWRLPGVVAVLALSPYCTPFVAHGTLGGIGAPVMYQTGTLDVGIEPSLKRVNGVYDESPAPKYYVEFKRDGHLAWTDLRPGAHAPILDYSLAFLDHYLRGLPAESILTRATSAVAELRHAER